MIKKKILMVVLLFPISLCAVVGSDTAGSRQSVINFPLSPPGDIILGYASVEKGIVMRDRLTTATFNSFMPLAGRLTFNEGSLYLLRDLVISNSCDILTNGRFFGQGFAMELGKQLNDFSIPTTILPSFSLVSTVSTRQSNAAVLGADSSKDDTYIAASTANATGAEVRIYYFDGSTLTTTKTVEQGLGVNSVAWNPKSNHLATARDGGGGNELNIYLLTVSNGTLTNPSGASFATNNATAVAWHQTGDFLAVGSNDTTAELRLYPFTRSTGALGAVSTLNVAPNRAISTNALSWSPGGNFLAAGTANNATTGATELLVCSFNGTSLTISTSAELGNAVQAVDWSPTGTYIAVGTSGLTTNLRIYNHQSGAGTLREQQSARTAESNTVKTVAWDRTGTYLLVGISSGATFTQRMYYFNPTSLSLSLLGTFPSATAVNITEWSNSNRYLFFGNAGSDLVVTSTTVNRYFFSDISLVFNSNVNVDAQLYFQGNCKINGRGKLLNMQPRGRLIVRPGANLVFEDVEIESLGDSGIQCLTDAASITFRNSIIELTSNYTFSHGSILFNEDVMITGTSQFNYTSALASTIASQGMLYFGLGTTFSYSPRLARRDLLYMTDNTSTLYLDGCTLHSTRTGLQLSTGSLIIDDTVTFSSEAQFANSALSLNSNLNIKVLNGGTAEFFGLIRYD